MRQIGALPLILSENGEIEVCLVTSRGGGRWIIPKGNPMRGPSPCDVAALEAREEAGVIGRVLDYRLGEFTLRARNRKCRIAVYPLIVEQQLADWDEARERRLHRCNLKAARQIVSSRSLADLIETIDWDKLMRLLHTIPKPLHRLT